jgi:hypothetical protein
MKEFGAVLGWFIFACLVFTVLNFFVKRINKKWIAPLPADSKTKSIYGPFMKLIVKNHRYAGIGAGVIALTHIIVQITGMYASVPGIIACTLLVCTVILGCVMYFGHKPKLIKIHRAMAFASAAAVIVHLIFIAATE